MYCGKNEKLIMYELLNSFGFGVKKNQRVPNATSNVASAPPRGAIKNMLALQTVTAVAVVNSILTGDSTLTWKENNPRLKNGAYRPYHFLASFVKQFIVIIIFGSLTKENRLSLSYSKNKYKKIIFFKSTKT